jgi:hypothetical protein
MAEETKTVTVAPGAKVYTGAGLHPHVEGDTVTLPAEHADDVVKAGHAEHAGE